MKSVRVSAWIVAFTALSCGGSTTRPAPSVPTPLPEETETEIELVESAPIETTLNHADVRDASEVWPEMIDRARTSIDFSEFYVSEVDEGQKGLPSKLAPVLLAIERAVKRGVKVRFIVDSVFAPKYPATIAQLRAMGVTVRVIDCSRRYGGVQHAKYFIVDGDESFVGSQNFDWRALAHIQEMGMRVRSPVIATSLADVFDTDWDLAEASTPNEKRVHHATTPPNMKPDVKARTGESLGLYVDPKGWLPDESRWDLTRVLALLDGAKQSIDLQVLIYSTHNRDKSEFTTLDEAMRRAAGRGVNVRVLVSHWGANAGSESRKAVESLAAVPNVTVKVLTIPPWSGGEIPFARVAHAKYMVVDQRTAWVGTSNWEGDYFTKTRNVSLVAEGGKLPPRLDQIFEDGWTSAYAVLLH